MLETIREQIDRYRSHGIEPRFVLMNGRDYRQMSRHAEAVSAARHNRDESSVNGLEIVICDVREPTVTATPGELMKHGLL